MIGVIHHALLWMMKSLNSDKDLVSLLVLAHFVMNHFCCLQTYRLQQMLNVY